MKNIFITLLVLFSIFSFAQNQYIGIRFGLNSSGLYGANTKHIKNLYSFSSGLTYGFKLKNNILLGAGLMYEKKGFQNGFNYFISVGHTTGSSYSEFRYTYLGLPLKAGYQIGQKWTGYFYLGLVPAYLLDARHKWDGITYNELGESTFEAEYDLTDDVNSFELSGMLEIGTAYQLNIK